ncbi:MAG: glycosyltransferase family 4 protein [Candidatus Pacebacteria bacterium]|nr:glycosyltransferase family 4 protein [Candidatus Paceibacterota bacterium]
MASKKTIGICHYRIGGTDGVSLVIFKRKRALEEMGYRVVLIAGSRESVADYNIPLLEFDRKDIIKIKENAFFNFRDYVSEKDLLAEIERVAAMIKKEFLKIHKREKFDYLFFHNIFSHGRHISAAKACCEFVRENNIKSFAVDHDFYFAGSYTDIYKPQTLLLKKYLKKYVPPRDDFIRHIVINSINQKILAEKTGLRSDILTDMFDFKQAEWKKDRYNAEMLRDFGIKDNDIVVLQATRIVRRKGIELAIDFVAELEKMKKRLIGQTLYNGKQITKKSKIVFVLAGYIEASDREYGKALRKKIKEAGISAKFVGSRIGRCRAKKDGQKIYSLWDAYARADLVTFPSIWEGWGNQFIEAVFAKKPVLVFEYPVFKADIKKEGYKVISLGSSLAKNDKNGLHRVSKNKIAEASEEAIKWLTDKNLKKTLERNFKIGRKFHNRQIIKDFFAQKLKL